MNLCGLLTCVYIFWTFNHSNDAQSLIDHYFLN